MGGRISDVGSPRPREVKKDTQEKAEGKAGCGGGGGVCVSVCDGGGRVSEKLHSEGQERTINTNLLPAQWATSSQVGVVSIAVNAIYLMYWPIMTSPLCVPAEGSPAVSQQATNAQLIGESFYFCKQTLTHASTSCSSFIPPFPLSAYCSPSLYLSSSACSSLSPSLPPSVSSSFSASLLSEDWLQAHCQAALAKINNVILIQTDIKWHRASKSFLCRLIISPCFSTLFIFCRLVPSIVSVEGSSGLYSPSMSEQSLDVTFDADKFGRVALSIHEHPFMRYPFL